MVFPTIFIIHLSEANVWKPNDIAQYDYEYNYESFPNFSHTIILKNSVIKTINYVGFNFRNQHNISVANW